MTIAYRASSGAQADSTGLGSLVLPSAIAAHDKVLLVTGAFGSLSLASTGTTPTQAGTINGNFGSVYQLWEFEASGSDSSAVITPSGFGSNPWTIAAAAWSGADLPLDVIASTTNPPSATYPAPSATTVSDNDWAVYLVATPANEFIILTEPAGSTSRINTGLYTSAIADSAAGAGASGSSIGGANWGANGSAVWGGFTVGLKPHVSTRETSNLLMTSIV